MRRINIPECWPGWRDTRAGPSISPRLGLLAQRRRELFLEDDPATHPPRRLPLDRRLADRHQCLSRRTQCQPQTVCLDQIGRRHSGQTRSLPCTICLTQCTRLFKKSLAARGEGPVFGLRLFTEAQASINVPSTEKCSLDDNRLPRAWDSTATRNWRRCRLPKSARGSWKSSNGLIPDH